MILTEEQKYVKIQEIARSLGVSVEMLMEGRTKEQVINDFESGRLNVITE